MKLLYYGLALSFFAFLSHLIVWKVRVPERQVRALLKIFIYSLLAGLFMLRLTDSTLIAADYLYISLFVLSAAAAYIITYPALEADSPSLAIVSRIAAAGPRGLSDDEIYHEMGNDILVTPRIRDLLDEKLVRIRDGKYRLTRSGSLFVGIFIFYRGLLNLNKGG